MILNELLLGLRGIFLLLSILVFLLFLIKKRNFWLLLIFGNLFTVALAFFSGDLLEEESLSLIGITLNLYNIIVIGYVFYKKVEILNHKNNKKD